MKAHYYGHSTFELKLDDGTSILFDPFITPNEAAAHIDISTINPGYILLSHAHEDHVADVVAIQQQSGAQVLAIVETAAWVKRQGVAEDKIVEFNFGGTVKTAFGSVKMVYALHTNGTPDGEYGGVAAGYVLTVGGQKIYFAGDTALTLEMKLLEHLELDWAFLPIGGHYTMDVDDAIKAADFIDCTRIIGIHYNTFPPIRIDKDEAIDKFGQHGRVLYLPEIGDAVDLEL